MKSQILTVFLSDSALTFIQLSPLDWAEFNIQPTVQGFNETTKFVKQQNN